MVAMEGCEGAYPFTFVRRQTSAPVDDPVDLGVWLVEDLCKAALTPMKDHETFGQFPASQARDRRGCIGHIPCPLSLVFRLFAVGTNAAPVHQALDGVPIGLCAGVIREVYKPAMDREGKAKADALLCFIGFYPTTPGRKR